MIASRIEPGWGGATVGVRGPSLGSPPSEGARFLIATVGPDLLPIPTRCCGLGHVRSTQPEEHGHRIVIRSELGGNLPSPPLLVWGFGVPCGCWAIRRPQDAETTAIKCTGKGFEVFGFLEVRRSSSFLVILGPMAKDPRRFWSDLVSVETRFGISIPAADLIPARISPILRFPVDAAIPSRPRTGGLVPITMEALRPTRIVRELVDDPRPTWGGVTGDAA